MSFPSRAWAVLFSVYLAGIAVAVNQAKVPPAMPVLIETLKIDLATGGWLMSSFAVAGVVLGIPAALLMMRLGPKGAGLLALGSTAVGAVLSALATTTAFLLAGRLVEGIGMGLIAVVAPAVISQWFPREARGLPMGLWASWVPVGGFLIYNLAGPLLAAYGWPGVAWFGLGSAVVAMAVYAVVVASPPKATVPPEAALRWTRAELLNPASWLFGLVFATFTFSYTAYSTWVPTYLHARLGVSLSAANFDASLISLAVIPATLGAGWVLDRTRQRLWVLAGALAVAAVLLAWSFRLEGYAGLVAPYLLALGLVGGFIPTAAFTLAPETMSRPEATGLALGILSVGQNVGMFFGPPAVAALVAGGQWEAGAWPLVAALAIGLAAALVLRLRPAGR